MKKCIYKLYFSYLWDKLKLSEKIQMSFIKFRHKIILSQRMAQNNSYNLFIFKFNFSFKMQCECAMQYFYI